MSLRRIGLLLGQEARRNAWSFMFVFAVVVPVVLTLVVNLLFGTLFSGKPTLGIAAEGGSRIVALAADLDAVNVRTFESADALTRAVETGRVDLGLALPAGFDERVAEPGRVEVTLQVWGQSLLQDRAIVGATVVRLVREVAGRASPVEVVTTTLGDAAGVPWQERLLPFIVLITVLIGGVMVPSSSLVLEKQKRTLRAVTITPASLAEVLVAKGLLGVLLSLATGVLILALNRAFGAEPLLLVLVLFLGGVMASTFGILLGALVKDINTLYATIKGIGLFLYAPAIFYLFPQLPQWIGRLFPTYYIVGPVVEISQEGAGPAQVAPEILVLLALIVVLAAVTVAVVGRISQYGSDLAPAT